MEKGKNEFVYLFFFLGVFLFRLNMFSIIHELGHLFACWMTGSAAVLKDWKTTEAAFLTPFSLYAGFVFEAFVLYVLSITFIWKEVSNNFDRSHPRTGS